MSINKNLKSLSEQDLKLLFNFYNIQSIPELSMLLFDSYSLGKLDAEERDWKLLLSMNPVYESIIQTDPMEALRLCLVSKDLRKICKHPHFQKLWLNTVTVPNLNKIIDQCNNNPLYSSMCNSSFWKLYLEKTSKTFVEKYSITWSEMLLALAHVFNNEQNSADPIIQRIVILFNQHGVEKILQNILIRELLQGNDPQKYFDDLVNVIKNSPRYSINFISATHDLLNLLDLLLKLGAKINKKVVLDLTDSGAAEIRVQAKLYDFLISHKHLNNNDCTPLFNDIQEEYLDEIYPDSDIKDKYQLFKWYSTEAKKHDVNIFRSTNINDKKWKTIFETNDGSKLYTVDIADLLSEEDKEDLWSTQLVSRPEFRMMGRPAFMRRNVGFFSDISEGYKYTGQKAVAKPLTLAMKKLLNIVNTITNEEFNGMLFNMYLDGEDYISAHRDNEKELSPIGVVALSLGAPRTFRIRDYASKDILIDHITGDGELMWMSGKNFHKTLTHEIPKESKIKTPRLSITFRHHKI